VEFTRTATGSTLEGSSDAQAVNIWNLILLTIPMMLITLVGAILFLIVIIVALIVSYQISPKLGK